MRRHVRQHPVELATITSAVMEWLESRSLVQIRVSAPRKSRAWEVFRSQARKNEIIAELSVLVLQAQGMLKGKKKDESQ